MSDTSSQGPIRVMIVDDSAVVRGFTARVLEPATDIEVVASVSNGEMAVNRAQRESFDVIILDIEMPVMDGLTALPKLVAALPNAKVVMSSTLTQKNASVSLEALSKGASDYIPKPSTASDMHSSDDFSRDLLEKVRALGAAARGIKAVAAPTPAAERAPAAGTAAPAKRAIWSGQIELRKSTLVRPQILAIGSSTGGPQALFTVFENLKTSVALPIVVTQHMPPTFTTILAEHIGRYVNGQSAEAQDGQPLEPGHVYIAPGDHHMVVASEGGKKILRLNQDPPENFCRPAVDPLFRSVTDVYNGQVLAVVLTGMGSDGLKGAQHLVENGGMVIAQDEESSVVWGMPGAVATNGVCSAVLPITEIGPAISRVLSGGQP